MAVEILSEWGGKLDCHTCDEILRKERGHDREGTVMFRVGRERIKRCPLTIITPLSYEYLKAFSFYEKGSYPNGLAWNKESNKYIQAMMILDRLFAQQKSKEANNKSNSG